MKRHFAPLIMRTLLGIVLAILLPLTTLGEQRKTESWYTVTVLPSTPYAYYRESIETTQGRIHFKTEIWKKEEGFINEEQLGAFAQDNDELSPLFYNFHSTYRTTELNIDGSVADGRLTVRIKKITENESEKPVVTLGLPKKTIFSSFFPVLIARQLKKQIRQGSFSAILEDQQNTGFTPTHGAFEVQPLDDFAKKSESTLVQVRFSGNKSLWYFDRQGTVLRIEMPAQKTRVDRVSQDVAKKFLQGTSQETSKKQGTQ